MFYLFSVHHWGLADLRALWEGETGWYDLITALSSYEAELRAKSSERGPRRRKERRRRNR